MDPHYAARYRRLYEHHWWWRARERLLVRLLERLAPPGGFGQILDVGCGDALSFPVLRRFGEPQGLEVDADLLTPEGRARGPIYVGPFDTTFTPPERFGLITMLDVVEHLDDDVAALAHAASLLAPGGRLVVTVPAFKALWTAHDDVNHHRRRYTAARFARSAGAAGLEVRERRYAFQWLVPLKLLVRCKERLLVQPPGLADVPAEPLNHFFTAICTFEQASWGRLPWPFGTSLVAVLALPNSA